MPANPEPNYLARVQVVPCLPCFGGQNCDALPADIIGAAILQIGMAGDGTLIEGGGLVIDYLPVGTESDVRRVVLAFSETGMWRRFEGLRP